MKCGEKIADLRKKSGMTQDDLGKAMNVSYQAVSKWERDESQPDFETMSKIAKLFNVPLSYFEEGGELKAAEREDTKTEVKEEPEKEIREVPGEASEEKPKEEVKTEVKENSKEEPKEEVKAESEAAVAEEPKTVPDGVVGTCTECGRLLKESEVATYAPKIVCLACAERKRQDQQRIADEALEQQKREREHEAKAMIGHGFDPLLIVSLVVAAVVYIAFAVITFLNASSDNAYLYGALLFLCPLALFAVVHAIVGAVREWKDRDDETAYTRNLSLVVGAFFAAVNAVLFLVLYLVVDRNFYFLILLGAGAVVSFTFVSQFLWGGVVKEIFTAGGFMFKIPGFIITLDMDSILWMIVTKILLGILSVIVFIVTAVLMTVVAMLGSVFLFIPSVIIKTTKDARAKNSV